MAKAIIKCPRCGATYNVAPQDLNESMLVYHCDECNTDFQVEYFDHCPKCKVNIGFVEPAGSFADDMKDVGLGILKTAIKPVSFISSFGGFLLDAIDKNVKDCNGDGVCPICNERYLRCPSCNNVFKINRRAIYKDKFDCPHCGARVLPCSSVRPGGGGKHSRAFYKQK